MASTAVSRDITGVASAGAPATDLRIPYRLLTVSLDLKSDKPVSSFLAATIRGGFGYTLKRLVCVFKGADCTECLLKNNCVYPFLFETAPDSTSTRMKKYRTVPRPFAFRPRQEGNSAIISLLLIGKAVEMFPFFVYTLNELGKVGLGRSKTGFTVLSVTDETGGVVYNCVKENECCKLGQRILAVSPGESAETTVTLEFTSPLVIRTDNTVLKTFEPRTFFTNLLRRVTNVNAFYGLERDAKIDPKTYLSAVDSLSAIAEMHPVRRKRISTRQHQTIDYSGITGKVTLTGNIGPLLPLIRAGEVLGVGKNTVFGYGVYGVVGGENHSKLHRYS